MNLGSVWEDDLLSFIGFLVLILPVPFFYAFLDSGMSAGSSLLAYYSFLGTAFFWMSVAVLYSVYRKMGGGSGDGVGEPEI